MTLKSRNLLRPTLALLLAIVGSCTVVIAGAQEASDSKGRLYYVEDSSSESGTLTDKNIEVLTNDTFKTISEREFNTVGLWRHIAEYNQLPLNATLSVGQVVKIPRINYRPREFAEVVYAHGDNQYIPSDGSSTKKLERNELIFLDDEIQTGESGFATVSFRTGASVNLQPSSHVKLVKLDCLESDPTCFIELSTSEGQLVIDVPKSTDPDSQENVFHVDTPHASAAVRGTSFDVGSSPDGMLLGVTSGKVAILADAGEISLPLGYGIKAQQDAPLGDLIELLPATTLRTIPPRVAAPDLISANPIEEAVSYEWKLSSDQGAGQIISQTQTSDPLYTLSDLEAGTYYLHIRGLDTNGLKGFVQASKINVAEIDNSFVPIAVNATLSGQDMTIEVIDPPENMPGYEVQLSATSTFEDPISVDIGTAGAVIFSQQQDDVFIRARGLITPTLITPFGPTLPIR